MKKINRVFHYLAMWGCYATGVIYLAIGIFAILSLLRLKDGGADESSMFIYLQKFVAGEILAWLIFLGILGYIAWRIYEIVRDPYEYGRSWKGIARRSATGFSGIADALIAYSAFQALAGISGGDDSGEPTAQRALISDLLDRSWGSTTLLIIGIVTCITAVVQLGYVAVRSYLERVELRQLGRLGRPVFHVLAWVGHVARGVILGIVGYFICKSALEENARFYVNTDKAFNFLGEQVGHLYFILVAAGTICYGLFMIIFGYYYDSDAE